MDWKPAFSFAVGFSVGSSTDGRFVRRSLEVRSEAIARFILLFLPFVANFGELDGITSSRLFGHAQSVRSSEKMSPIAWQVQLWCLARASMMVPLLTIPKSPISIW